MGDLNAVDYAQLAHMNLVRSSGGLRDETLLRYRAPVPRGPTWDGVVIDDRVVVEKAGFLEANSHGSRAERGGIEV